MGFLFGVIGAAIITGLDGVIAGVAVYPIGASILAVGLIFLATGTWEANKLPRWIPALWVLSTLLGFSGYFTPGLGIMFVISGVIFGLGFAGAGMKIWRQV